MELFASESGLQPLPLPGAELWVWKDFALGEPPGVVMQALLQETSWRSEEVKVWGRLHPQPRLIAWHGDPGRRYAYAGLQMQPMPWTDRLQALRLRVQEAAGVPFNSVLLNLYRDGRDSMGFHSDDEPELGPAPVIASLSLGATRGFVFKSRRAGFAPDLRLRLDEGCLLLMRGETQKHWKHGVPKQAAASGPRINLTFRQIAASDAG